MNDVRTALLSIEDLPGLAWLGRSPFDRDGFTHAWLALRGRTLAEEAGDQWLAGIHPRDRAVCREAFDRAARAGKPYEIEYRLVCADGGYRRLRESAVAVRRDDGALFIGSCVDITDAPDASDAPEGAGDLTGAQSGAAGVKTAAAAAVDTRVVLDHLPAIVLTLDQDLRVLHANRAGERAAGASRGGLVGEHVEASSLPSRLVGALVAAARRVRESGVAQTFEAEPEADPRARGYAGEVVPDAADPTRLFVMASPRARAAGEPLPEALEGSADGDRSKDEFLALVSHELRSPLNSITGWTHVLEQALKSNETATLQRAVEGIKRSSLQQAKLIADLMDAAYLLSGKLKLYMSATSLPDALAAAVEGNRAAAEAKRVGIEIEVEGEIPLIAADPDRLQQMAWHLLAIAIKFSQSGGRVDARIRRLDAARLALEVRDRGRGFTEDGLARALAGMPGSGAGIGLSLVRRLAELHGGELLAESEGEGKGASFRLVLPVQAVAATAAREQARALEGIDVMLVGETDAGASGPLSLTLAAAGAGVVEPASVDQALATFEVAERTDWPDLLVCDTDPVPGGRLEFIRKLRALESSRAIPREARLPTLAITTSSRPEDHTQLVLAGFEAVLVKPFAPQELTAAVSRVVGRPAPN